MPYKQLEHLYKSSTSIPIKDVDRFIIISDLHMGNNTRRDDFRKNAKIFETVLRQHYLPLDYTLILNGDIEELQKFSLGKILQRWSNIYTLFKHFDQKGKLVKIVGNHDAILPLHHDYFLHKKLYNSLVLKYKSHSLFFFHGHQASNNIEKYNSLLGFALRYIAKPLGFKNASTAYNSRRKFRVEKRVYGFSAKNKIVSIIGHTHRPLFDSLSKEDLLKYKIEQLVRLYPQVDQKEAIEAEMATIKQALKRISDHGALERNSLYNSMVVIPCLFNSGCVIGKRGFTAIEIADGDIQLVYWYDDRKHQKKMTLYEEGPFPLAGTHYSKLILKKDHLDYIFNKIKLLADCCDQ
ncbi:metallophosphoesterase [candidate division KSB1 bacterium]|nr:metallophosphoesterase family protein [candidate division KSB1 bacterium]RQW02390.1 MAG: metallophosphoesterase [candidate division KSB1 bacterium]